MLAILLLHSVEAKETVAKQADYIIGADGAYSAVRRQIITTPGFDYSQSFIEHGYLELSIPATAVTQESAMPAQYLHIWPRGHFMMIALPNKDCSWTVTLFMPLTKFNSLTSAQDVIQFFKEHFLDYVQLVGEVGLSKMYFSGKPQPLVMVKVGVCLLLMRLVLSHVKQLDKWCFSFGKQNIKSDALFTPPTHSVSSV